ncbi:hypothetical protein GDO81_014694 [Engystomops pustulosus]|uniref:Uncharacterized protein n=2 Tax=Engystomops pustulosus TaxID=76066 RepID=A0AAV7BC13_ENGPU|nr:hypothetical protein GDO81_014694 [Engystomops pustulosus]
MELNNDTLQNLTDEYVNFDVSVWLNSGPNIEQNTSLFFEYESYNVFDHIPNMCIIWYSVTLILGVIGNGLVIWITGFRMKTVNAVWFFNLAIADFVTCLSLPLRISEWALYYDIYYDHFLCTVGMTILFINMLCNLKRKFVKSIPIMLEKVLDERSDIDCGDTTATTMLQTVNQHLLVP